MGKPKVENPATIKLQESKKERKAPLKKATRKVNKVPMTMKVEDLTQCRVIGLEHLNDLARKYRGKLNLSLKSTLKKHNLHTIEKKQYTNSMGNSVKSDLPLGSCYSS